MGDITRSILAGFKDAPSCLAAILLVGFLAYFVHVAREAEEIRSNERFMAILKMCSFNEPQLLNDGKAGR